MASPLPPNATGKDVAVTVFAGCGSNPIERATIAGTLLADKTQNTIYGGIVGTVLGFGLGWYVLRKLRKAGHI